MKQIILAIILLSGLLLAIYLGLFAQDIAYYFENHLFYQSPDKTLMIVTVTSVSLFVLALIAEIILYSLKQLKWKVFITLLFANILIGFFISMWSLFVLAMWRG